MTFNCSPTTPPYKLLLIRSCCELSFTFKDGKNFENRGSHSRHIPIHMVVLDHTLSAALMHCSDQDYSILNVTYRTLHISNSFSFIGIDFRVFNAVYNHRGGNFK